ncbi:DUF4159 domain-containing protein [Jiulongibacter sp. NS-SX5]|uniref:DUF4159 domain-containing protein n=1 Tax=Jiulongibacter sp. NS-SX5 TaxID=3463854 RepID=UPI0040588760
MKKLLGLLILALISFSSYSQGYSIKIAKLKYGGGGDWYANKTALPNLIDYCNKNLLTNIFPEEDIVEVGSPELFQYPFLYMTGHGNVVFTESEAANLRKYLLAGGFLHVDDNYGLRKFIEREMKKVLPEANFVELPFSHPIYHQRYEFANGLPKIHEHDNKPPQGFGLFHEGRMVCFFSFESDLGNGWEDQSVYGDPESVRQKALQMGANILIFAFSTYQ